MALLTHPTWRQGGWALNTHHVASDWVKGAPGRGHDLEQGGSLQHRAVPGEGLSFGFFNIYFIYLFLAALGLCCCAGAFSSCGKQGLLFVAVRRLLIAVVSLVVEHGL